MMPCGVCHTITTDWDSNLQLGTHISVDVVKTCSFTTVKLLTNYLIIVLYHQSFVVFINIKLMIKYTNDT